ncbi:MAG: hypothetical protein ACRDOO_22840 [Actinomadura sp.]
MIGAISSTAGMTVLVWTIISGSSHGWTGSTVIGLVSAITVLAAFAFWQLRTPHPIVPLRIFRDRDRDRDRDFSGAAFSIVLLTFASAGFMLALTQYLQLIRGYDVLHASLINIPFAAASVMFNGIGAALGERVSNRTQASAGLATMAIGFLVPAL